MTAYLIIASDIQAFDAPTIRAPDVYRLMMDHGCWEFPPAAPHLAKLTPGSHLFFYLGGNHARYVAGEAVVASEFTEITASSAVTFNREQVPFFRWRLPLCDIVRYPGRRAGLDTLMDLSFARDRGVTRPYIGLLLRVGLRALTDEDVTILRRAAGVAAPAR